MTLLARMIIRTTGFAGAPGINVWHFSEGSAGGGAWAQAVVDDLYDEVGSILERFKNVGAPGTMRVADAELAIIESTTGELVDAKTPTTAPVGHTTGGSEPGDLPRAVAMLARFQTNDFVGGRRLKGRAFIGPMSGGTLTSDGLFSTTAMATIEDGFPAITTGLGARLAVYSRPDPGSTDGYYGDVVNVSVRPTPSYLSSRSV